MEETRKERWKEYGQKDKGKEGRIGEREGGRGIGRNGREGTERN